MSSSVGFQLGHHHHRHHYHQGQTSSNIHEKSERLSFNYSGTIHGYPCFISLGGGINKFHPSYTINAIRRYRPPGIVATSRTTQVSQYGGASKEAKDPMVGLLILEQLYVVTFQVACQVPSPFFRHSCFSCMVNRPAHKELPQPDFQHSELRGLCHGAATLSPVTDCPAADWVSFRGWTQKGSGPMRNIASIWTNSSVSPRGSQSRTHLLKSMINDQHTQTLVFGISVVVRKLTVFLSTTHNPEWLQTAIWCNYLNLCSQGLAIVILSFTKKPDTSRIGDVSSWFYDVLCFST